MRLTCARQLAHWILKLRLAFLHSKCAVSNASYVLVEEMEEIVKTVDFSDETTVFLHDVNVHNGVRFFIHKGLRYVWNDELGTFQCYEFPVKQQSFADIHARARKSFR